MLQDYIEALPDDVELIENNSKAKYKNLQDERSYRKVPVNELHDLIYNVMKCEQKRAEVCTNLLQTIKRNQKHFDNVRQNINTLSPTWSKNDVTVTVNFLQPLQQLLNRALYQDFQEYQQQQVLNSIHIKITDSNNKIPFRNIPVENITDVQALLALVVVLKCYPPAWYQTFFWDAWLAVTIQLSMLIKIDDDDDLNNEVFPCLWMKQVFVAERLVKNPDGVYCLLMGQDPVSNSGYGICLRAATGIAFHNIGDRNKSIEGMTTQYGLDCTGDWPIEYCKQGLLLVNMIRCIPKGGLSMSGNPYYGAWFVYTLKLSEYFSEKDIPVVMMYNKNFRPTANLVEYILKIISDDNSVCHPAYAQHINTDDKNKFYKLIFKSNLPILWDILGEYINALPDNITIGKYHDENSEYVVRISSMSGMIRRVPIDNIFIIVNSDHTDAKVDEFLRQIIQENIWQMLPINVQQIDDHFSNTMSFANKNNQLRITVVIPDLLKQLLQGVVGNEEYNVQYNGTISITHTTGDMTTRTNTVPVTGFQAILALVIVLKCYPPGWRRHFFWDAWLAVTIQLGLLTTVNDNNSEGKCLWMKELFYAEWLAKSPEKIYALVMAEDISHKDITCKYKTVINYGLDCSGDWPRQYCRQGLLLASTIRCRYIPGNGIHLYYDVWCIYTLKLTKYFSDKSIPIIVLGQTSVPMTEIIPEVNVVKDPYWGRGVQSNDRDLFHQHVFNLKFPIFWEILQDYVTALPDKVEDEYEYFDEYECFVIQKDICTRKVPPNLLHNIIYDAVHCKQLHQCATKFLNSILSACELNKNPKISFCKTDQGKIDIPDSLEYLLRNVMDKKVYIPQSGGLHTINITVRDEVFTHEVTDLQVLLALVTTMKCYPKGWRDHFFWDVWLAITIQLDLLKRVDSCSTFDTLCRLWIYKVFYAEQLIENPEKVHCLLIVNDYLQPMEESLTLRSAEIVNNQL